MMLTRWASLLLGAAPKPYDWLSNRVAPYVWKTTCYGASAPTAYCPPLRVPQEYCRAIRSTLSHATVTHRLASRVVFLPQAILSTARVKPAIPTPWTCLSVAAPPG